MRTLNNNNNGTSLAFVMYISAECIDESGRRIMAPSLIGTTKLHSLLPLDSNSAADVCCHVGLSRCIATTLG